MIDWTKPIEPVEGFNRTDAEVLCVRPSGNAVVLCKIEGCIENVSFVSPSSREWRNVPELSARDLSLLRKGWLACMDADRKTNFLGWYRKHRADLAREFPAETADFV